MLPIIRTCHLLTTLDTLDKICLTTSYLLHRLRPLRCYAVRGRAGVLPEHSNFFASANISLHSREFGVCLVVVSVPVEGAVRECVCLSRLEEIAYEKRQGYRF